MPLPAKTSRKKVVILGSTGSIGMNTLEVVRRYRDRFSVFALSAYNNQDVLMRQIEEFHPRYVAVRQDLVGKLSEKLSGRRIKVISADDDLPSIVSHRQADTVVIGMSGSAALTPFLKAVEAGKTVAPANKEALVIAGELIMGRAAQSGAQIIPVDSEQSAIFQCLQGQRRQELKRIHLTASGGSLRKVAKKEFDRLTVSDILKHPRWKMGKKITVDSATLMNKGFEVIEAQRLFGLRIDQIEVVVHPEAIIHSMAEFCDGSILAQLGVTDMRLPIQYALTYPARLDSGLTALNFSKLKTLTFEKPDLKKFPCLGFAFEAATRQGTDPCVLNAADEQAVAAFLSGQLKFTQIPLVIERVLSQHRSVQQPDLEEILAADRWAREAADAAIMTYHRKGKKR